MKVCLLVFICTLPIKAQDGKVDPYRYRPYTKFYEKGKEGLRAAEYLKYKDSDVAKKYFSLFSSKKYNKLTVYQVSNYHRINNKITINKMVLYASFKEGDAVFKQFVGFFKKAFPEKCRRAPEEDNSSQILVFSGKKESCIIYIPGILGPEFAVVEGAGGGVRVGSTYGISNFGMSATPPSKYFWKMYVNKGRGEEQSKQTK